MLEMLTAYTTEVDDVEAALQEIFSRIDLGALKKNSVGLITCHFDFTDSGFIDELCKKLPFDVIGMTTMASANEQGFSMYALVLTVLTSDDLGFATALSGPLGAADYCEKIGAAYAGAVQELGGAPSMIIAFFPYLKNLSGAMQVRALDEVCGGVPIWGSQATNIEISYEYCQAFRNGGAGGNALAMLLVRGPVETDFVVVSLPEAKIRENRAIITGSEGCLLRQINGIPALKYLESLGITIMENAAYVTPLMVYYEGASTPVALAIFNVNEDGSLLCGGEMTEGASLSLGEINAEGIMDSAEEGVRKIRGGGKKNGALILPCVSRYVMLEPKQDSEMELISRRISGAMPFMLGYSGGEVCPVRDDSGRLRNRFHNYTFSACVF